jgi:hypothetical protein
LPLSFGKEGSYNISNVNMVGTKRLLCQINMLQSGRTSINLWATL